MALCLINRERSSSLVLTPPYSLFPVNKAGIKNAINPIKNGTIIFTNNNITSIKCKKLFTFILKRYIDNVKLFLHIDYSFPPHNGPFIEYSLKNSITLHC